MSRDLIWPVILSGGSGTRLWPLSRGLFPKQLLELASDKTMIQETALRVADRSRFHAPMVIANHEHRFLIAEQLRAVAVAPDPLFLEPEGRNTAAAVAVAALIVAEQEPDGLMLVMPSDHVIADLAAFHAAVGAAEQAAHLGRLVTFGIKPDRPETGYGYIKAGAPLTDAGAHEVAAFVEKPDRATAEEYLESGAYSWNSGIFLLPVSLLLSELEAHAPDILSACRAAVDGRTQDLDFVRPDTDAFKSAPSDSIDYAVMEKTDRAAVVKVDMGWNDLGSFEALWQIGEKDEHGNVCRGDVISSDTEDSLLISDGPAVASLGVDGLVVVATKDAVLVCDREKAQDVKAVVEELKRQDREERLTHTVVYRPWGSYETTDLGERFQTKRLVLNPGAKLSLQKHHHRAEHWIVVRGSARVTCDDRVFMLSENESTFIPVGAKHRLENPGKIPLHIIEVQSGSYLGEDDIIRFEDTYGRE